ncbi:MAG: triose-phosphate isomerase [Anaerolineales bacterium]|jgi:triosephosphate isomerase
MRQPILAANWKMNLGRPEEALEFLHRIRHPLGEIEGIDRVLCPPFTALSAVAEALSRSPIKLGAQNLHYEEKGAFTGEIAAAMIADLCAYVILGHSERRATGSLYETDAAINKKLRVALAHGLTPILCVGEKLDQKQRGETRAFIRGQIRAALEGLSADQVAGCVIAYEPIWAIGTGQAATPADANQVIFASIRATVAEVFGEVPAQAVRVQYGGSVSVENIAEFMRMPEIDGALVGGASLKMDYVELVRQAAAAKH